MQTRDTLFKELVASLIATIAATSDSVIALLTRVPAQTERTILVLFLLVVADDVRDEGTTSIATARHAGKVIKSLQQVFVGERLYHPRAITGRPDSSAR